MLESGREPRRFTVEEYLWLEERAQTRNEFLDGHILAMTGGSLNHNRIVNNLVEELRSGLRGGPCEVFQSDVRLYVKRSKLFTYPDILVVCGKTPLMKGRSDTLTDARVVVEVLSPSTETYDRQTKFRLYRGLSSLEEYVVVSQDAVRVERSSRQPSGEWLWKETATLEGSLELPSLGLEIPLRPIYHAVRLPRAN